jgi:spoIIIJ-associated protein
MLKKIEVEAKTLQEATKKASDILKIAESKLKLEIVKEKKGFLGVGSTTLYEATPNIDLTIEGKQYLESIVSGLGAEVKMEIQSPDESTIVYRLQTNENALLIGKEGKTLLAIQTLLRNHLSTFVDDQLLITLDIGNYHASRKRQLEILATKTAKDVARSQIAVKLDPMNAFDRRIVHEKLSEWRDVETYSEGDGEERAIIIRPKK